MNIQQPALYETNHIKPVDFLKENFYRQTDNRRGDRMSGKGLYDIHCHIVPGVDDGATDIEETRKLLQMEYDQGVRTIIATPHFRFRMFETPVERVNQQFQIAEKAAAEIAPDLQVYSGCEFHANMYILPMLIEQMVMTIAGSRYVLKEFSHNS